MLQHLLLPTIQQERERALARWQLARVADMARSCCRRGARDLLRMLRPHRVDDRPAAAVCC